MARKTSRRVAAPKRKKSARKGKKSTAAKRTGGATARSASSRRKAVSVVDFVRCIRTLHDLGLVGAFVQSAKEAKLTLTMDAAAFGRVKKSVNKRRRPASVSASMGRGKGAMAAAGEDPFDFGSNDSPGGLGGIPPFPHEDPFDF